MSVIEYQKLKYNVSQGINWITEGRQLLYMGKPFLPNDCENNIQDVLSFLDKLEEEKHVAIDSLEVLKDLLEGIEKWNLLQMVKKFESKRKEYKSLLEQCGRELDERSQLEQLISICEGKISHDRQGHMTDIWTLFTELEKENNLGIKRLEILKTMAIKMKKPYLLQQVEKFENKREQEEDAERERRRSQGDIQGILERVDEGMKEISKKLDILTEPGGVAARDEDILDNIQQVRKEMIHIGKTLEMLRKPEKKTKNAELEWMAKAQERMAKEWMAKAQERMAKAQERMAKEWMERMAKERMERMELAQEKALRDSSPSVPSLSSVGGGLADAVKVEVEPKQQKQKEGSRVEFK